MPPRPRLLTVVRDPFPPCEVPPDRSDLEELLDESIEFARADAARLHPAEGPSNVVPFSPRRRSQTQPKGATP